MSETDDLLDSTLDDLEDLPEFKPFPPGAHRVSVSMELKEVSDKKCVEMSLTHIETLELSTPTDTAPTPGDSTNVLFFLDNEFGRGNLKACGKPLAEALGTTSIRDTIEATTNIECLVLTSNDKDKKYTNIKELNVV